MEEIPPVPSYPEGFRKAQRSSTKESDTRRHSFSPNASTRPTISKRRASSRAKAQTQQPSPEVITSLISSLSAISTPADTLFDSLLPAPTSHSVPASPSRAAHSGAGRYSKSKLGIDHRPPKDSQGNAYLHPNDAALPPVIRTSKPPSGFSQLTSPKKSPTLKSTWPSPNPLELELAKPIGNVSIMPSPLPSPASAKSFNSDKSKNGKDLRLKESKEKMREIDNQRRRKSAKSLQESRARSPLKMINNGSEPPSGSSDILHSLPTPPLTSPEIPTRMASKRSSSIEPSEESLHSEENSGEVVGGRRVPQRESSLRHSTGSTPLRRKRKSYRSSLHTESSLHNHVEIPEERSWTPPTDIYSGEDSALKRIRELKAQKEERERSRSDEETQRQRSEDPVKAVEPARSSLPSPAQTRATSVDVVGWEPNDVGKENEQPSELGYAIKRQRSVSKQKRNSLTMSPTPGKHDRRSSFTLSLSGRETSYDDRASLANSIDDAVEDYLAASRLSQKVLHPQTGRKIVFSEVGDPNGSVVFCCVGMGTTRFLTAFYDELAVTLKLRLITPDRPGIGDSQPYGEEAGTPLSWPDDVSAICQHLNISRFSVLAHSAGAIYALALALRMPQQIRGRIHILAPWIPPSQMRVIGIQQDRVPVTSLPYTQRILRSLPTPFLKAANSSFFSMTSTSLTSLPKSPRRTKRRSLTADNFDVNGGANANAASKPAPPRPSKPRNSSSFNTRSTAMSPAPEDIAPADMDTTIHGPVRMSQVARQGQYDARLTQAIWAAATANANPAVDLLVCLERGQEIGFRYVDVAKAVVMHHGSRDSRVPVENVRWLGGLMRRCEVRVLEGEGHGLMASASVMGGVLGEISKEWADWNALVGARRAERREKGK